MSLDKLLGIEDVGLRHAALLGAMLYARERGDGDDVEDQYLDALDICWREMTLEQVEIAERSHGPHWSKDAPTVNVVLIRQKHEAQPPRFWYRSTKPDGHGNERYIVEMRVMDGKVFWLKQDDDRFKRWTEFDPAGWPDCEWAGCFPPLDHKIVK